MMPAPYSKLPHWQPVAGSIIIARIVSRLIAGGRRKGSSMDLGLKDKIALVTGAAHGLGNAICRALAAEGARVAINYHRQAEPGRQFAAEISQRHGVDAIIVPGDVAQPADVRVMFDQLQQHFAKPAAVLVNNARFVRPVGSRI